jgi:Ca2+-binding EF-hand superfamily protein
MASKDYLKKLKDAMEESSMSVEDLFKEMDTDGDGTINGPELYKGVKKIIGERLTPDQISMMIMAIDTNEDNRIGLPELQKALS